MNGPTIATGPIDAELVAMRNAAEAERLDADHDALAGQLSRRGLDIEAAIARARDFAVAVPSWGVGTGGTRFARFPGPGEPRDVFDKLDDCGVIHQLTRATPRVSLHIPWDDEDPSALVERGDALGLGFDAMNSNTFQDQPGQTHSYRYGSLSHVDAATRAQAIEHNRHCIDVGRRIGSTALTVWIGDGSNFPGQSDMGAQFERYLDSLSRVYAALPDDWRLFTEHKMYEPAFYSTVVQDWGSNLMIAQALGEKASCLVDLGHHAPNVNIEMIVSRLHHAGKLGGFHFNDSKYGDDDLDSGAIEPYRLFLVFNELLGSGADDENGRPAYMLDQSHNVTDPIESLMNSAIEVQRACVQASLVDREALAHHQANNDALMASETLKAAFRTDVSPILARARQLDGGAIDPVATFRAAGYRPRVARERPAVTGGGGGIV